MPCMGLRGPFALRSRSNSRATAIASGFNSMSELRVGPRRSISSIRARYFFASETAREFARLHRRLKLCDGHFVQFKRLHTSDVFRSMRQFAEDWISNRCNASQRSDTQEISSLHDISVQHRADSMESRKVNLDLLGEAEIEIATVRASGLVLQKTLGHPRMYDRAARQTHYAVFCPVDGEKKLAATYSRGS